MYSKKLLGWKQGNNYGSKEVHETGLAPIEFRNAVQRNKKLREPPFTNRTLNTKTAALRLGGLARCLYYDILPEGESVTSEVFCGEVQGMVAHIPHSVLRRRKLYMIMDNARPHHPKATQDELRRLGVICLSRPPPHTLQTLTPVSIMPSGASKPSVGRQELQRS